MKTEKPITSPVKKIGVLLSTLNSDKYLYNTLNRLSGHENIEIYYLLNENTDQPLTQSRRSYIKNLIKKKGLFDFFRFLGFIAINKIEKLILRNPDSEESNGNYDLTKLDPSAIIKIEPHFSKSGLIVRYDEEDLHKINKLELDIIIRGNAPGIFKGGIITVAKRGIISFHHGDNRWNRGGPAAYWEVYLRKPSTGFIIQILTESLDGGAIIYRGAFPTQRTFTENKRHLFEESNPYLSKLLIEFAETGKLPKPEDKTPFDRQILKSPTLKQSVIYGLRVFGRIFKQKLQSSIFKKQNRWSVGYYTGPWQDADLRKCTQIKNPTGHFYADPFIITQSGRTICFVEDYNYDTRLGCISAIEILNKKRYQILGPVIEEPYHMSFPYLFTYKNELYMIPETYQKKAIQLFKCIEFPMKWEFQQNLMEDCQAVDTMVFQLNSKWWLLTNLIQEGKHDENSALYAFYSSNPITNNWSPHQSNPIVLDSKKARNGGILYDENRVFRVRQKHGGSGLYGAGFSISEIQRLTPELFEEKQIGKVDPFFLPKIKGNHTLNANEKYTVFDFVRFEKIN